MMQRQPRSTLFPCTTLFRSRRLEGRVVQDVEDRRHQGEVAVEAEQQRDQPQVADGRVGQQALQVVLEEDRKSTRLNSSHANISYVVFCLTTIKLPITLALSC